MVPMLVVCAPQWAEEWAPKRTIEVDDSWWRCVVRVRWMDASVGRARTEPVDETRPCSIEKSEY